jgi:exopolysaccharide production protein ExoF
VLTEQIQRFEQQIKLRDSQIAQVSADLGGIEQLRDQGLAANARVTAMSTQLSDLESKRLDLENARLLAEQQLNQATRDELSVTEQARTDFLSQLRQVNADISANEIKLSTATALYSSAIAAGAMPVPGITPLEPEYVVTPASPDQPQAVFEATEPLPPGSTLEVVMKVDETASVASAGGN